jgi:xanthine dehydrogenase accessory factor
MSKVIAALAQAIEAEQAAVLVTVIEVNGASPAKAGAQLVLLHDGKTIGTVGGGNLEAAILADAHVAFQSGEPRLAHYALRPEGPDAVGALCGGELRVFLQPYRPAPSLVIVGGGHIGQPLQAMAAAAGFRVSIVDIEAGRADTQELEAVSFTEDSYAVLITTDYLSDETALRYVLTTPARYIGMIGSQAKCQTILNNLRAAGFDEQSLGRISAPIGLDLGGPTPGEIALAILAEIVAIRRSRLGPGQHQTIARRTVNTPPLDGLDG